MLPEDRDKGAGKERITALGLEVIVTPKRVDPCPRS